jgi:hypothetical protein
MIGPILIRVTGNEMETQFENTITNDMRVQLTNLSPRNTLKPSTNSKIKSNKLADTIIKSKIFHPHRKKSFDNAITFIIHSNVNTDVNTLLPISNASRTLSLIPWCSNAKNIVFNTIHNVIANSNNGSLTICGW